MFCVCCWWVCCWQQVSVSAKMYNLHVIKEPFSNAQSGSPLQVAPLCVHQIFIKSSSWYPSPWHWTRPRVTAGRTTPTLSPSRAWMIWRCCPRSPRPAASRAWSGSAWGNMMWNPGCGLQVTLRSWLMMLTGPVCPRLLKTAEPWRLMGNGWVETVIQRFPSFARLVSATFLWFPVTKI